MAEIDIAGAQPDALRGVSGICWPPAATVGHIAVATPLIDGYFPGRAGADAIVLCQLLEAGKYRNGARRAWCRTHQRYWGVQADLARLAVDGRAACALHAQPMGYALDPLLLDLADYAEVGIYCAGPDRLHVSARPKPGGENSTVAIDCELAALALACTGLPDLFQRAEITRLNLTPPAALAFTAALAGGHPTGCVDCARCGYPHLDLGDFALAAHRRHYCGNCGHDATHSKNTMVSSPLHRLREYCGGNLERRAAGAAIDLDAYPACRYAVRPVPPALLWTGARAQETGLRVRIERDGVRIVDDIFGKVTLGGREMVI